MEGILNELPTSSLLKY